MMKNIAICLCLLTAFCVACQQEGKDYAEEAIEAAEKSEIVVDTIMLGFRFGMSEKQVEDHFKTLLQQKKVYPKDKGYGYDIQTQCGVVYATIHVEYYQGQLYKIELYLHDPEGIVFEDKQLRDIDAVRSVDEVFKKKAEQEGYGYYITHNPLKDTFDQLYIKNNLIVRLSYETAATMVYLNAPVDKQKRDQEELEIQQRKAATIQDL